MGCQCEVHWANDVIIMPYFPAIGQRVGERLRFNVRHLRLLEIEILVALRFSWSKRHMPSFVDIGQTVSDI